MIIYYFHFLLFNLNHIFISFQTISILLTKMYYNNATIICTVWAWRYIYRFSNCFLSLYHLFFTIYKSFYSFEISWFQSKKTITTCNKDLHRRMEKCGEFCQPETALSRRSRRSFNKPGHLILSRWNSRRDEARN